MFGQGVLGRKLFVDVHPETGGLIDEHVAILHSGTSGKDLLSLLAEVVGLLYSEIPDGQVKVGIGGVTDG